MLLLPLWLACSGGKDSPHDTQAPPASPTDTQPAGDSAPPEDSPASQDSAPPVDSASDSAQGDSSGSADSQGQDSASEEPPPRVLTSGEHDRDYDGLPRSFRLTLPDSLQPGAPLIVALHGYGSSSAVIQSYSGLDELAEREGAAVVYPQALPDSWGWRCWNIDYCLYDEFPDDVGFIRSVIEEVREDQGLQRVLVTGMSNGGDMSYHMACAASELVDAIAPVTGCMMTWLSEACTPADPPPVMHIHGNADPTTLWEGDPSYVNGGYLGTMDSVGVFAALHEADTYSAESVEDKADGSLYILHRWATDDGDTPVMLYEIDGGRHSWPDGGPGDDLDSAELMWSFFQAQEG